MLWQLLHLSDNHGNSLKKSFFEKGDFSISDTYRRSIGVWSYDLQAVSRDALPLSYKRQVGGKSTILNKVQVTNNLHTAKSRMLICTYAQWYRCDGEFGACWIHEKDDFTISDTKSIGSTRIFPSELTVSLIDKWHFLRYWAGSTFAMTSLSRIFSYYSLIKKNNPQVD